MSEQDIQNALNESMLEAAREVAEAGQYDEAFEDILGVLAVDPTNLSGQLGLFRIAGAFFDIHAFSMNDPRRAWWPTIVFGASSVLSKHFKELSELPPENGGEGASVSR